jgi:hypothetical protein
VLAAVANGLVQMRRFNVLALAEVGNTARYFN